VKTAAGGLARNPTPKKAPGKKPAPVSRAASPAASRTVAAAVVTPCVAQAEIRALLAAMAEVAGYGLADESASSESLAAPRRLLLRTDAASLAELAPARAAVLTGPPAEGVAACQGQYGLGPRDALSHTAHCLAHAVDFARGADAVVGSTAALIADPDRAVPALAQALGFAIARPRMAGLVETFREAVEGQAAPPEPVAGPLAFYGASGPETGRAAWWGRDLFWSDDTADRHCPDVLDITGRGRILAFGPFLALPPGRWRAALRLSLNGEAAARAYVVDFGAGDASVARNEVWPAGGGRYELPVEGAWATVTLAQVRLWLMTPAFDGEMRIEGASVTWLGPL
jgi:hypothetical protein